MEDVESAVRVVVASGRPLIRAGLVALLEGEPDLRVIAQTGCDRQALVVLAGIATDVVVIDCAGDDPWQLLREALRHAPAAPVVALAGRENPAVVRAALDAGVTGMLDHDASPGVFVETVRQAAAGREMIDPRLAMLALRIERNPFTQREGEVLKLLAEGASNAEIAGALCLSVGTVRNYVGRILKRLQARSRVDAVRMAHDAGWL